MTLMKSKANYVHLWRKQLISNSVTYTQHAFSKVSIKQIINFNIGSVNLFALLNTRRFSYECYAVEGDLLKILLTAIGSSK